MRFNPVAFIYKALQVLLALSESDLLDSRHQHPHPCNEPRYFCEHPAAAGGAQAAGGQQRSLPIASFTAGCPAFLALGIRTKEEAPSLGSLGQFDETLTFCL